MKGIEIPFGAKDSELCGWEYKIPEGMEAVVANGKVIVRRKESEDERIRKVLIHIVKGACNKYGIKYRGDEIGQEKLLAYLEKQKEQEPDIELIQRSWYLEGYHDREFGKEPKWIIKIGEGGPKYEENPKYGQMLKEQKPDIFGDTLSDSIPDDWRTKISTNDSSNAPELKAENMDDVEACMLRYLQSASNRKDDDDIMEDTRKYKQELFELMQKPAAREKDFVSKPKNSVEILKHYLTWATSEEENCPYSWKELADAIRDGIKALEEQKPAEWMVGQFQKIDGSLVDWYETNGVEYCCGISTNESFEVPEGFYIRKK